MRLFKKKQMVQAHIQMNCFQLKKISTLISLVKNSGQMTKDSLVF